MRLHFILVAFLPFFLCACANEMSIRNKMVKQPGLNPDIVVAFYEQQQGPKDRNNTQIRSAFGKYGFNWGAWQNLTKQYDMSAALNAPIDFKGLFQGEHLSTFAAQAINNSNLLTIIKAEKGTREIPMSSSSKLPFDGFVHPPVLLVSNLVLSGQPSWKSFIASEKLIESTMSSFQPFVENGLIEKNNVRKEDLEVLDAVQLNNNAKVLTLSINTLSNRDDLAKEKRYKSFYFNAKNEMTDLTFEEDVRFEGVSTGLNSRFLDACDINGEMVVFFWIWDGVRTGYRLFRPSSNVKIDQWR